MLSDPWELYKSFRNRQHPIGSTLFHNNMNLYFSGKISRKKKWNLAVFTKLSIIFYGTYGINTRVSIAAMPSLGAFINIDRAFAVRTVGVSFATVETSNCIYTPVRVWPAGTTAVIHSISAFVDIDGTLAIITDSVPIITAVETSNCIHTLIQRSKSEHNIPTVRKVVEPHHQNYFFQKW